MPPPPELSEEEEVHYALCWLGCACATELVCGVSVWALCVWVWVCVGVLCESLLDECGEVSGEAVHGEAHHVEVAAHTKHTHANSVSKWDLPEAQWRCPYNCQPSTNGPFGPSSAFVFAYVSCRV
jgi:hypothetical protein